MSCLPEDDQRTGSTASPARFSGILGKGRRLSMSGTRERTRSRNKTMLDWSNAHKSREIHNDLHGTKHC
jgi:hypothetical protein